MALSSKQHALKGQRLEKILGQKSGSKSARMTKLWQFWQGHPKPAFCKKVQRGGQRKFFKNRLESRPRLKGPTALQRKRHYTLISMQLQGKDWRRFWGKNAAPKVPEWPSYGTFCKVTQFFKNRPKSGPRLKGPNALWRKWHYPLFSMRLQCKDWKRFWRKKRLQKCPKVEVMAIQTRSPKTRIFSKSANRGPNEIFQNRLKSSPRFNGPTTIWRKWHYPLISMHLWCKDWRRFWRKRRL